MCYVKLFLFYWLHNTRYRVFFMFAKTRKNFKHKHIDKQKHRELEKRGRDDFQKIKT